MEDLKKYLEFNKKIEIEKLLPKGTLKRYKTALYKESDSEFYFFTPKEKDDYINFSANETIRIVIYSNEGIYTFKSTVSKDSTKLTKVIKPEKYKKVQRRGLLRVNLPVKIKIEYKSSETLKIEPVKIVDISGSGVSFNTDLELFNIKRLNIHLEFENHNISTFGEIIEIRKNRDPKKGLYRLSVRFLSLNKKDTEYIIKHCIIHQIKTIKHND